MFMPMMERPRTQEINRSLSRKLSDNEFIDKSLESRVRGFRPQISEKERKLTRKISDIDLNDNTFENRVLDLKFKAIEQERKILTRKISGEQQKVLVEHTQRLHRRKLENERRYQASAGLRRAGTPFASSDFSPNINRHVVLNRITSSNGRLVSPITEQQSERTQFDIDEESGEPVPFRRGRRMSLSAPDLTEIGKVNNGDSQNEHVTHTPCNVKPRRRKTTITGLFRAQTYNNEAFKTVYPGGRYPPSPPRETSDGRNSRCINQNVISLDKVHVEKLELTDETASSNSDDEDQYNRSSSDNTQSPPSSPSSSSLPFLPDVHSPSLKRRYGVTKVSLGRNDDGRLRLESRRSMENLNNKSINDLIPNREILTTPDLVSRPKCKNLEGIRLTSANKSPKVKDLWKRAYDFARMDSFKSQLYGEGKTEQYVDGHEPAAEKNARECLQDPRLLRLVEILTSKKNASDLNF